MKNGIAVVLLFVCAAILTACEQSNSDDVPELKGKLVKSVKWVIDDEVSFFRGFDYDEEGNMVRIIDFEYDFSWVVKYPDKNTISFLWNGDDAEPLNYELDSRGYLVRAYSSDEHYIEYEYSSGMLASMYVYSSDSHGVYTRNISTEYENGNCMSCSVRDKYVDTDGDDNDSSYEDTYTLGKAYTDIENKMNVDVFSEPVDFEETWWMFKGISSRNLPSAVIGIYNYEYEFDDDGYVTEIRRIALNEDNRVDVCHITY